MVGFKRVTTKDFAKKYTTGGYLPKLSQAFSLTGESSPRTNEGQNPYQLNDSTSYHVAAICRLAGRDYLPYCGGCLWSRTKTIGITEIVFGGRPCNTADIEYSSYCVKEARSESIKINP
jgi:hypothetical protein